MGTIYGEYYVLPELSIRLNIGGDVNTQRRNTYVDRTTITGATNDGIATKIQGQNLNYLLEGLVNYNKSLRSQDISAVFGITTQTFRNNNFAGTAYGFPSDATKTFSLQLGDPALNRLSSNESKNKLLSYLGRVNYSVPDKYLITASFRIDGSSRFGENNKFGYFLSFALGWKLHQEDFFAPLADQISTLKPRISWGQTGNQEIGNLNPLTTFGSGRQTLIGAE